MRLSFVDTQVINEMAKLLCDFLPGNPHPYANPKISFLGVAQDVGLSKLWMGGSKLPAITMLLLKTLESHRDLFCKLIIEIVNSGLIYRNNKKKPMTRDEIQNLNKLIVKVGFKIPELWNPEFLDSLPLSEKRGNQQEKSPIRSLKILKDKLIDLYKLEAHKRGYAFEKFLKDLFKIFDLEPRSSFKLVGEQIDGSLQLGSETYLIEAKWQKIPIGSSELILFDGKVKSKSEWSRGLFISYSGFTEDGLEAFSKGRSTNIICMNGQDLFFIVKGKISLTKAIDLKSRRAAETGKAFITVQELELEN